jgi:phosphoribosylformylglycinamidine cyclo-ligase
MDNWPMPPVFTWLKQAGNLTWPEMLQTFNCGVGFALVVDQEQADDVLNRLKALHESAWLIGDILKLSAPDAERVVVDLPASETRAC